MTLDLNTFDASGLTLIEVLDMSEAAGIDSAELVGVLNEKGMSPTKARVLYALAWCIIRRQDPDIKFSDVITWKLTLIGKVETKVSNLQGRARARVNAAKLTGLPPAEAEKLTIAELAEYRKHNSRAQRVDGGAMFYVVFRL
jgi:hypothetical protein